MVKKFIGWIYEKIIIDRLSKNTLINEREVYWCSLGENIGFEQNGKGEYFRRPVLVFKKFNNCIFWGIPMSTKIKDNKYYVKILLKDVEQCAILSQLRVLDTRRLDEFMGYISEEDFIKIQNQITHIIWQ